MNLLAHERRQRAEKQARECWQFDVSLTMRRELACWMMEVCELQLCEEGVFSLAMSYVRICLFLFPVHQDHMRLLGSTCLLLASKMRNEVPLTTAILEHYTGYSVTSQQIREWESFILKQLRWDLAIIIPHDFLDYMLERLFFSSDMRASTRKNASEYMTLCSADCYLSRFASSIITGVCIAKAMLDLGFVEAPADDLYIYLSSLAETTTDELLACKAEIESAWNIYHVGDHTYMTPTLY